ncbi:RICIN domain-containing protein [Embleya sp. NPDC020630]|uniref:RICIN domain-containing protein n=1 Tax=Embleya sp. NPDC020630 TaxID=3363979 RepID=UPI0037873035
MKIKSIVGTLGAAATLVLTAGTIPAHAGAPRAGNIGWNYGMCLEIENSSTANGARAQIWSCAGQRGSYWYSRSVGSGYYEIRNSNSGKCLEIENSSTYNGARAQQWDCKGQPGSLWRISPIAEDFVKIQNASGKYLEVDGGATYNGARVQQWQNNRQQLTWAMY